MSDSFGFLNEEGKRLWGSVYPDGKVPLVSIIQELAELDGLSGKRAVYRVPLDSLSSKQFGSIVEVIATKNQVSLGLVRSDLESMGFVPIRAELVSGVGTTNLRMFL